MRYIKNKKRRNLRDKAYFRLSPAQQREWDRAADEVNAALRKFGGGAVQICGHSFGRSLHFEVHAVGTLPPAPTVPLQPLNHEGVPYGS